MRAFVRVLACTISVASVCPAATADSGPSMQETEQYIASKLQEASVDINRSNVSISSSDVSSCSIAIHTYIANASGSDGGHFNFVIPAKLIWQAVVQPNPDEVAVIAWHGLSSFSYSGDLLDSDTNASSFSNSTSEVSIVMPDPQLAQNFSRAVDHYLQLCGSVDPDASDPFSK